ncbi:MAG: hypothetical protein ACLGHI_05135 [Gammaproteobacteria bacterium]
MSIAIIITSSMIWSLPAFGEDFAKEFVQSAYVSCYKTQRAMNLNNGVPEKFIINYCDCTSNRIYKDLSYEDLNRLQQIPDKSGPPPHGIQKKLNHAGKSCMKDLIRKMSPSELKMMDQLYDIDIQRQ